ncbi:MAG TPA: hypothetical protein IAB04_04185 [Candidatus Avimonoglobus intestinipullorum]|uniref:TraY domain-containing protein n=1 Tax=Candidatus Avimonoglobus intestinipullorum TaxID=2840699 RepID=A0A9D1LV29_9FIRM|nr:hypothetical protein [Candidatus Avimonoglobus intestinipullorum]
MAENQKHVSFRMNIATHNKMRYIAYARGQTVSGRVAFLVRKDIERYEKEHGEITKELLMDLERMNK